VERGDIGVGLPSRVRMVRGKEEDEDELRTVRVLILMIFSSVLVVLPALSTALTLHLYDLPLSSLEVAVTLVVSVLMLSI
jgi:hypothetical protein